MWKNAPFRGVIVINLLGIIHMTDRRNTPENTANDTIQSPFPQYSPKMPEMEENPTVQPHFADFGLTSAPNETNAAKATVQRLFGRFQGILGQIRRFASNDLKLPLKCGKTALHRGFPRHLQAILPLNTDKASNKRRIAQITPSAYCYA